MYLADPEANRAWRQHRSGVGSGTLKATVRTSDLVSSEIGRFSEASQVALAVKNPLLMQEIQETQVRFLGQEDPPEEGMATHSSVLA